MKLGDDYRERLGLVEGEDVISLACGCGPGAGLYIVGETRKAQEAAQRHYDDCHGESMDVRILRGVAAMLAARPPVASPYELLEIGLAGARS